MTGFTTYALALERSGELHRHARLARAAAEAQQPQPSAEHDVGPRPPIARVSWRRRLAA